MVLNIYIIRHAETDFNKQNTGFLQSDNIKLNPYGLMQLENLKRTLLEIKFDKIFSSTLERAKQTTEFLFGKNNPSIIFDERLLEYIHGKFSPDSFEWKEEYQRLLKTGLSREEIRPFGGENIWDLIKRAKEFLIDLEKNQGNIAIISHSGTNEVLINLSQGKTKENFDKIKQDNACINHLIYENGSWKIKRINDTRHLEVLEPEVEIYPNQDEIRKEFDNFINNLEELKTNSIYQIGRIKEKKIGRYNRTFMRYSGTPLEFVSNLDSIQIRKDWKIVTILEDYSKYCIGELKLNNIKHKINMILTKKINLNFLENISSVNKKNDELVKKAVSIIYNPITKQFLLKKEGNSLQGFFSEEIPFEEIPEDYVKKLFENKFGLNIKKVFYLNWGSVSKYGQKEVKNMNFLSFVDLTNVNLQKSLFKWVNLDEFIKDVAWEDNKDLLKKVLEKAIIGEIYFDKKERGQ